MKHIDLPVTVGSAAQRSTDVSLAGADPSQQLETQTTRPGHDATTGRFLAGNSDSMKDGKYSLRFQDALLPGQEGLREAIAERRIEWAADLGHDLSFSQQDLVNRGLRLHVILDTLEASMERNGVLTPKGSTRAAVTLYLSVLDRLTRIYQQLGLERRAQRVQTLNEIMHEHAEPK